MPSISKQDRGLLEELDAAMNSSTDALRELLPENQGDRVRIIAQAPKIHKAWENTVEELKKTINIEMNCLSLAHRIAEEHFKDKAAFKMLTEQEKSQGKFVPSTMPKAIADQLREFDSKQSPFDPKTVEKRHTELKKECEDKLKEVDKTGDGSFFATFFFGACMLSLGAGAVAAWPVTLTAGTAMYSLAIVGSVTLGLGSAFVALIFSMCVADIKEYRAQMKAAKAATSELESYLVSLKKAQESASEALRKVSDALSGVRNYGEVSDTPAPSQGKATNNLLVALLPRTGTSGPAGVSVEIVGYFANTMLAREMLGGMQTIVGEHVNKSKAFIKRMNEQSKTIQGQLDQLDKKLEQAKGK